MTIEERNSGALNLRGRALMELGRFEEAEASLRRALDADALNAAAHNNLGILYVRSRRRDEARREFENALKINPELSEAKRNLEQL